MRRCIMDWETTSNSILLTERELKTKNVKLLNNIQAGGRWILMRQGCEYFWSDVLSAALITGRSSMCQDSSGSGISVNAKPAAAVRQSNGCYQSMSPSVDHYMSSCFILQMKVTAHKNSKWREHYRLICTERCLDMLQHCSLPPLAGAVSLVSVSSHKTWRLNNLDINSHRKQTSGTWETSTGMRMLKTLATTWRLLFSNNQVFWLEG